MIIDLANLRRSDDLPFVQRMQRFDLMPLSYISRLYPLAGNRISKAKWKQL